MGAANDSGWQVSVLNGLSAHFEQPSGPSKAGTDWAVWLTNGAGERRILVRIYEDNLAKGPKAQAKAVLKCVASLLQSGWYPDEYKGKPGELTVPTNFNAGTADSIAKPWWRFW
jgi:hypothetical protein